MTLGLRKFTRLLFRFLDLACRTTGRGRLRKVAARRLAGVTTEFAVNACFGFTFDMSGANELYSS